MDGTAIKMDHQVTKCDNMCWVNLTQGRELKQAFVNTIMKLKVPYFPSNFTWRNSQFLLVKGSAPWN